jgi:hypothetical protein
MDKQEKPTIVMIEVTTLAKILSELDALRAQSKMLSSVVTGLCMGITEEGRQVAISLLRKDAEMEPKHVVGEIAIERGRSGITRLASSWVSQLSG